MVPETPVNAAMILVYERVIALQTTISNQLAKQYSLLGMRYAAGHVGTRLPEDLHELLDVMTELVLIAEPQRLAVAARAIRRIAGMREIEVHHG